MLGGLGLGAIAGQLADLQLGELLDTPPPGLDEAVAIAKVSTLLPPSPHPHPPPLMPSPCQLECLWAIKEVGLSLLKGT